MERGGRSKQREELGVRPEQKEMSGSALVEWRSRSVPLFRLQCFPSPTELVQIARPSGF